MRSAASYRRESDAVRITNAGSTAEGDGPALVKAIADKAEAEGAVELRVRAVEPSTKDFWLEQGFHPDPSDPLGLVKPLTDRPTPAQRLAAIQAAPTAKEAAALIDHASATVEQVTAVGEKVVAEAEARIAAGGAARAAANEAVDAAQSAYQQNVLEWFEGEGKGQDLAPIKERWEADPSSVSPRARELFELEAAWDQAVDAALASPHTPLFGEALPEILGEIRAMGGTLDVRGVARATSKRQAISDWERIADKRVSAQIAREVTEGLERAAARLPADWVERSNRAGKMEALVSTDRRAWELNVTSPVARPDSGFAVLNGRIKANRETWKNREGSTILHELTHRAQGVVPDLQRLERDFWTKRTANEDKFRRLSDLRPGYGYEPDEIAKPDDFADPYTGRYYSAQPIVRFDDEGNPFVVRGETGTPAEVVTTGIQGLYFNEFGMRQTLAEPGGGGGDRELTMFVAGLLAAI